MNSRKTQTKFYERNNAINDKEIITGSKIEHRQLGEKSKTICVKYINSTLFKIP
jgi:hypothetical protein